MPDDPDSSGPAAPAIAPGPQGPVQPQSGGAATGPPKPSVLPPGGAPGAQAVPALGRQALGRHLATQGLTAIWAAMGMYPAGSDEWEACSKALSVLGRHFKPDASQGQQMQAGPPMGAAQGPPPQGGPVPGGMPGPPPGPPTPPTGPIPNMTPRA
jgi:hypothetical protein